MPRIHTLTLHQLQRIRRIERQRARLIATAGRLLAQLEADGWTGIAWLTDGPYEKYLELQHAVQDAVTQDGEA